MKNKKTVIWIVLLAVVLAAALLIWKSCGSKDPQAPDNRTENAEPADNTENTDNTAPADNAENAENSENTENAENAENAENTEPNENGESGEGGASIIEDGGDLVIVIPDDQGSGGL